MNVKPTSEKEVCAAIKDCLKKSGHLNKLQAQMRAKITELLRDKVSVDSKGKKMEAPQPSPEVLLVNELVREYLEWNGYLYTASVLACEAAMPEEKKTRLELCCAVGVKDDEKSSALPLLLNIVAAYIERIKRKICKMKKEREEIGSSRRAKYGVKAPVQGRTKRRARRGRRPGHPTRPPAQRQADGRLGMNKWKTHDGTLQSKGWLR